ncbi:MAG: type secretory pathway component PulC [Sphingomonas bacterium]|jgi:general secretion pathway protein C|nr:type secretory pathway component PulC [Sphingomonas bacterium]MDB5684056.1 type secretory pathway component PulC [Sphingomonas bacterium]
MRLVLDPRARRWLRRLPRYSPYSVAEFALLSLLAIQCARLLWVIATPVNPLGDWRPAPIAAASETIFGSFDPFFRSGAAGGPLVVTALDLKLFGTRADRASGRGSAIIGTPDGAQASYVVGEEVQPGVTLEAVAFDNVTILRGGAREQIFLDQSQPATIITPAAAAVAALASPPPPGGAKPVAPDVQISPRLQGGQVTGFAVDPVGIGASYRAFGFQPGDVLLSVNGISAAVATPEAVRTALSQSGEVVAEVERGGKTITLRGTYNR